MRRAMRCLTGGLFLVYLTVVVLLDLAMALIVLAGVLIAVGTP
jgi:hypothetical protein